VGADSKKCSTVLLAALKTKWPNIINIMVNKIHLLGTYLVFTYGAHNTNVSTRCTIKSCLISIYTRCAQQQHIYRMYNKVIAFTD